MTSWLRGKLSLGRHRFNVDLLSGENGFVLRFVEIADFSVSFDGRNIDQRSHRSSDPVLVRELLSGPVLTFSLALQGVFPLHASAASCDGGVVGFIGPSGSGKSSLITTCISRGWQLLSDSFLVVLEHDQAFWGQPGNPSIRLRPDAATHFVGGSAFFQDFSPDKGIQSPKLLVDVGDGWGKLAEEPRRLAALYLLEPSDGDQPPDLADLSGWEAIQSVLVNTYTVQMHPESLVAPHFEFATRLLETVPLKRLRYHPKLAVLPEMFNMIRDDVGQMTCAIADKTSAIKVHPN